MKKNTVKINSINFKFLSLGILVIICSALTLLNLMMLYFLPGNIFSDLSFVLIIFFILKHNGLSGLYFFFYGVFYLVIGAIIAFLNNPILTNKWSSSISFYLMALFILSFFNYFYEKKLEIRTRTDIRKKIYSFLLIFFIFIFLIFAVFFNLTDIKVYFFNKFYTEKYFNETEILKVDGEEIYNAVNFSIEEPKEYSVINGFFLIKGWAIDESALPGTNIDYIGVYINDKPQEGGKFISSCEYENMHRSVDKIKGNKYDNSEFRCHIDSTRIEDGLRKFYIAFHSNNFGWNYGELELFIHNNDTFAFDNIFDKEVEGIKLQNASFSSTDGDIVIEEGKNIQKSIVFPIKLESGYDYLFNFEIKALSDLNNNIYFDFFDKSYNNPEQGFVIESRSISEEYEEMRMIINSGDVPLVEDTYFRISTNSGGSLKIKNLAIYEIYKK